MVTARRGRLDLTGGDLGLKKYAYLQSSWYRAQNNLEATGCLRDKVSVRNHSMIYLIAIELVVELKQVQMAGNF